MAQDESRKTHTVRVATYNIHRGRGLDGRTRLERIAAVLATIDADIVALQEVVGASPLKPGQAAELGAALGMGWVMAPTRHLRTALFGNVVLSRFPVRHHVQHDLTWQTCEPRNVQRVDLEVGGARAAPLQRASRHRAPRAAAPGGAPRHARPRQARHRTEDRAGRLQRVGPRPGHRHPGANASTASTCASTCGASAPIPASSRSFTSITSTSRGVSR